MLDVSFAERPFRIRGAAYNFEVGIAESGSPQAGERVSRLIGLLEQPEELASLFRCHSLELLYSRIAAGTSVLPTANFSAKI